MDSFTTVVGYDEDLPVSLHHDIYPTIDPKDAFANRTYSDKVVLVTGASRGIGQEIAITYSKAGANVVIAGRFQETLDKTAAAIRAAAPEAQVLSVPVDVRDPKAVEAAVQATLKRFGKLDVLIANAGALSNFSYKLGEKDPDQWWNTFEVNVRGVYNAVRASIPALEETNGYIGVVSSGVAQLRIPGSSDYAISKHTVGRLVEFIALEHPKLKVFALHPGAILTQMVTETGSEFPDDLALDTVQLPAATMLSITSGRFNWLNGRYLSSNWDLGEVERDWKERIQAGNELVSKLSIPK
ncbi:NAD-P-binding protein [Multifurca ochricompacta]|uniref:NAD-P-binding protein n=1 Tax=Multifurca ochricompacta TaxID=376703 RepID=A0AAD4MAM4_9AGAM|nr:NAD-P-binding protein [Multifurca ochricompacta]